MTKLTPSPEQRAVLNLGLATVRIRAGAGTGKTTTVAMIIANLVKAHRVEPERILGITFTNKAASELADRVTMELGSLSDEGRQVEVHTYHGFAAQVLAEFGSLAGIDPRIRIVTPTFSRQILTQILHGSTFQHLNITNRRSVDQIRTLSDRLSDHLQTPDGVLARMAPANDVEEARTELLAALIEYQDAKRDFGVVDYGDLVTLSTSLLQQYPELADQVRRRYQVLVLDEYQDTNPAQRVLLTTIFGNGFPVIAVGDEDQTIYEWRGATPENFELFTTHFDGPDGAMAHDLALTGNRRSAPEILSIANAIRHQANPGADDLIAEEGSPEGVVTTFWASDGLAEADWITERFGELHDDGTPWREMAVLIRKNKDFPAVVEAMRRADIPVEVANLGGLLVVPEIAELRSWLTILDRPGDSAATLHILFGSSYRLGLADIAPLASWAQTGTAQSDLDVVPDVSIVEALENLDEIKRLRNEARDALQHFAAVYRALLIESQGASLVETCRLILDKTRAWQNAESLPPTQRLTARLNLYRMLDLAEDWSPLSGRPSLTAFLDHLDAMEEEPAEELDAAHLSGEDAVTLVTVHRAKGLEWDVVAIPNLTKRNFPGTTTGGFPDPVRFAQHLPAAYRIDSSLDDLPADEEARKEFFRSSNLRQEWRVAYVAATRARKMLLASGAYWYGNPEPNRTAKEPSELFELIAAQPGVIDGGRAEAGLRPDLLRRDDMTPAPDPHFPGGWAAALRSAVGVEPQGEQRIDDLGLEDLVADEIHKLRETLFALEEVEPGPATQPDRVVSVTGLVTYAQCPKRYFWSDVDPLPRRRNPAAVAGTELHRRIELFQRGQVPFEEVEASLYDVPDDAATDGDGGWPAFKDSRFADEEATLVETPFVFELENEFRIRGRIDAVYSHDGHWEIVDFKSGKPNTDEARLVQLESYAVAAQAADMGIPKPKSITVTFAYLGGGLNVESYEADDEWIAAARARLHSLTEAIDDGEFSEKPGPQCDRCDFLKFCGPGTEWLASR